MLVGETTQTIQTLLVGSGFFGKLLQRSSPTTSSSSAYTSTMAMNVHVEKSVGADVVVDDGYHPRKGHEYQKTRLSKPVLVRVFVYDVESSLGLICIVFCGDDMDRRRSIW